MGVSGVVDGLVFALGLVASFFVGNILSVIHVGAYVLPVAWCGAFMVAGAIAGHSSAGRRGLFSFAIAFAIAALGAWSTLLVSVWFHDTRGLRPYQRPLDLVLFTVAIPLTFSAMAVVATGLITRDRSVVRSVAGPCAFYGVVGGLLFAAPLIVWRLGGLSGWIALASSIGIPAFLTGRRLSLVLRPWRLRVWSPSDFSGNNPNSAKMNEGA